MSKHTEIIGDADHKFVRDEKGRLTGLYEIISSNTHIKTRYVDDKKNGPATIHIDGKLVMECTYVNGAKHGLAIEVINDRVIKKYYLHGAVVDKLEYLSY